MLIDVAKVRSPCIVFIDEIDSVGAKRTSSQIHPYANQTINQLLSEMDGWVLVDRSMVVLWFVAGCRRSGGGCVERLLRAFLLFFSLYHNAIVLHHLHQLPAERGNHCACCHQQEGQSGQVRAGEGRRKESRGGGEGRKEEREKRKEGGWNEGGD